MLIFGINNEYNTFDLESFFSFGCGLILTLYVSTVWEYRLPGPGSLSVWLPVLSGVQWHSAFAGPCTRGIWLVCSERLLPSSVRWDPGRKEAGRESLSLTYKNWCWEMTWEGLNSWWTQFWKWAKVTSTHSQETGQTTARSHSSGAVWSGHFILFPKTALPKSHLVTLI